MIAKLFNTNCSYNILKIIHYQNSFYKLNGINFTQKSQKQQLQTKLKDILKVDSLQFLKQKYVDLLSTIEDKNMSKFKQLTHPMVKDQQSFPNLKLFNKEDNIQMYFGQCYFGYDFMMKKLTYFDLDFEKSIQSQNNDKPKMVIDLWPFEQHKIIYKYKNFIETMDFNRLLKCRSRISLQLLFVSKIKLTPPDQIQNQEQQTHQMRIQLWGQITQLKVFSVIKGLIQYQIDHNKNNLNLQNMVGQNPTWRIVQLDNNLIV